MRSMPKAVAISLRALFSIFLIGLSIVTFLIIGAWISLAMVQGYLSPVGLP